jgi:magnesium and cobalt transporter
MNDDRPSTNGSGHRSWLERLTDAFLGEPRDRDQLIRILRDSLNRNLLDADALAMIEGVLQVAEMQVRDIMIPRSQMVVLERDASPDEMVSIIVRSGHSRFPVIGESRDEVSGILLAKDMLWYYMEGQKEGFNVREMLRPASFIPESKRLNVLLKDFRSSRNHMAIVVDEYGGVAGMVTIEDVLEQIVGEIEDEHDVEEGTYILEHDRTRYTVKALTPIDEFNEHFGTTFSDEEFDTVGGLLLSKLGHLPKRGESLHIDGLNFKVLRSDNRRIHLLQVTVEQVPETSSEEGA